MRAQGISRSVQVQPDLAPLHGIDDASVDNKSAPRIVLAELSIQLYVKRNQTQAEHDGQYHRDI